MVVHEGLMLSSRREQTRRHAARSIARPSVRNCHASSRLVDVESVTPIAMHAACATPLEEPVRLRC